MGWGTTERERETETDGQKREKEGGRMQCFMKKEYKSILDVENVETTGESSLCTFIGMKHINLTYISYQCI